MIAGRQIFSDTERLDAVLVGKFNSVEGLPPATNEVAFIGRSNSGKSSLIKALLNANISPQVSARPGNTRLMQFYALRPYDANHPSGVGIIDFPGYGYAQSSQVFRERFSAMLVDYLNAKRSVRAFFLMMDAKREVETEELEIARVASERRVPVILCLNKVDGFNQSQRAKLTQAWKDDKRFFECVFVSAKKRQNISYISNFMRSLK